MQNEIILNVFPGATDENRLVLAQTVTICGRENLVLRQETHSPDIGWFVQSYVAIEPGQVAALKMTLSPGNLRRNTTPIAAARGRRRRPAAAHILQFDEAS